MAVPAAVNPPEGVPARALEAYVQAAEGAPCPVPWWDLAAVGAVETGHGTHGGAHLDEAGKMTTMAVSWADAKGPMQFIDSTWSRYGQGDVNDIDDAAPAAARLLCANGWEQDRTNAFGAYNGGPGWEQYAESRNYVVEIDRFADAYRGADPGAASPPGGLLELVEEAWLFVGGMSTHIGAEWVWQAADRAMFAGAQATATPRADRLDPTFGRQLDQFIAASNGTVWVNSGFRSEAEQQVLWDASDKSGTWVAPPGSSFHNRGLAADLGFSGGGEAWAHANAARYRLTFPMSYEPWHVELEGIR